MPSLATDITIHIEGGGSPSIVEHIDQLNAAFYTRFPYPPLAAKFEYLDDPDFERVMLCQSIGDFTHRRLPPDLNIWVVGCGTNQAIQTALRFPQASVLGTDLSPGTLELVGRVSASVGIENLVLRQQSLADVRERNSFDYILCTGVIHHNADPGAALATIARALKPNGILELMVYNTFHRSLPLAFQHAVRTLGEHTGRVDCDDDMKIARALMKSVPSGSRMGQWLDALEGRAESDLADLLIQPVEHTYTVKSLATLAGSAGLELVLPVLSPLMKYRDLPASWDLEIHDGEFRKAYESLPDVERWQIANLLLNEDSPMLWFYLQRHDSSCARRSQQQICDAFLDSTWMPARTMQKSFIRESDVNFRPSAKCLPYPLSDPEPGMKLIRDSVTYGDPMRVVLQKLGRKLTRPEVNEIRTKLTIPVNPYLRSISQQTS
jgi:SAM-dependent methyltransferase